MDLWVNKDGEWVSALKLLKEGDLPTNYEHGVIAIDALRSGGKVFILFRISDTTQNIYYHPATHARDPRLFELMEKMMKEQGLPPLSKLLEKYKK